MVTFEERIFTMGKLFSFNGNFFYIKRENLIIFSIYLCAHNTNA